MDGWVVFDCKREENGVEVVDSGFTVVSFGDPANNEPQPKTEDFTSPRTSSLLPPLLSQSSTATTPSVAPSTPTPAPAPAPAPAPTPIRQQEEQAAEVRRPVEDAVDARLEALQQELDRVRGQLQAAERRADEAEAGRARAEERALVAEHRLLQIAQKERLAKLQHPPIAHLLKNKKASKRAGKNTQLTLAQQQTGSSTSKRQHFAKGNHRTACSAQRNV